MTHEPYATGADLSEAFPKFTPPADHPLPPFFDDTCKKCGKKMERVYPPYWTRHKPFATFLCECKTRLFIFEAPGSPLFVWSDALKEALDFSTFVDQQIGEREKKKIVRAMREGEIAPPYT